MPKRVNECITANCQSIKDRLGYITSSAREISSSTSDISIFTDDIKEELDKIIKKYHDKESELENLIKDNNPKNTINSLREEIKLKDKIIDTQKQKLEDWTSDSKEKIAELEQELKDKDEIIDRIELLVKKLENKI